MLAPGALVDGHAAARPLPVRFSRAGSGGGVTPVRTASVPSAPILEHAKIVLDYFATLKADDSQMDVEVKCSGRLVCMAHRLVLAAFSSHFKIALLGVQDSPMATLDIDTQITGVPWPVLEEIIDFCYTGQCRFSLPLLEAARFFRCPTLIAALERAQTDVSSPSFSLHDGLVVDEFHAATYLEALYQFKIDSAFIDCLFSQKDNRAECVRLHRLVLCAYARHFEVTLRDAALRSHQVSLVIDNSQLHATSLDLRCVVDFFYMGYVRAARKRLRSIRATAAYLGVEKLVAEIDKVGAEEQAAAAAAAADAAHQQEQGDDFNEEAEGEERFKAYRGGEASGARAGSSSIAQRQRHRQRPHAADDDDDEEEGGAMDEDDEYNMEGGDDDDDEEEEEEGMYMNEYDYGRSGSPPQQQHHLLQLQQQHPRMHDSDVVGSSVDEYSTIYEHYVDGPKRGKRGGTYARKQQPLKVKGRALLVQRGERGGAAAATADEVQAVTMSCAPPVNRGRRGGRQQQDSFGYGLPEIHAHSDVTVPLVVGDQQTLMERPYKCPYCEHRTREKSAVEKHVRCLHTLEAPYKCRYCAQAFKVQSNLVRHIRAHTGEKPYACRKCGVAYADKKNMDAHVYREHLKMRQFPCDFSNCSAKFWRNDRYFNHYTKLHGPLPSRQLPQQQHLQLQRWTEA